MDGRTNTREAYVYVVRANVRSFMCVCVCYTRRPVIIIIVVRFVRRLCGSPGAPLLLEPTQNVCVCDGKPLRCSRGPIVCRALICIE